MSKEVNLPDSQNDVITTATHVLYAFEDLVRLELPNIPIVYSEELGFEEAVKEILARSDYNGSTLNEITPFFAYNRTILLNSEDRHLGDRARGKTGCTRVGDNNIQYGMTLGEFDIQFIYVSNNVQMTDQFEVTYNSDEGITGSKELVVGLDDLGDFKYFLDYQELQEKTLNIEGTYYKMIIGSLKVRGFYFTFRSTSGIIKEINQRIIASRNLAVTGEDAELSNTQIT